MSLVQSLLVLFLVALACCAVGFHKYVYFISIGYGFAISGLGIALLVMFRSSINLCIMLASIILILYGVRLSGYLLLREIASKSYQKHMKTEIKDGSSLTLMSKIILWIFCAILYEFMIAPILFRFYNGYINSSPSYIIGISFMIFGIVLETWADYSKYKQKKLNPARFCDKGVFAFVRCPNYLGELILWTGVLIVGITSLDGVIQWIIAILGYIGIVFVMFSGARRLELRQKKNYGEDAQYQKYIKSVPILIPFIPLYSVEKYKFLVL